MFKVAQIKIPSIKFFFTFNTKDKNVMTILGYPLFCIGNYTLVKNAKKWTLNFHIPRFGVLVLKCAPPIARFSFKTVSPGPKNRVKGGVPVLKSMQWS